jgi:hypothetical protein
MTGRASRLSISGLTAAVVLAVCPAIGQAQSFAFAIGSGGHCHHHHHCGSGWSVGYGVGPWWGPAWYAPPPAVVVAPAPVVQERVIYVQQPAAMPPPPPVSPYKSSSASPSNSLASSSTRADAEDDRIVIYNAANAKLPVSFLVDGQDIKLEDGATRTFVGKTHRMIEYDRGGRFGSTQQDLAGGHYEFRITATGWDLVRKPKAVSSRTAVRSNTLPDTRVAR